MVIKNLQYLKDTVCAMLKNKPIDESEFLDEPLEAPPAFDMDNPMSLAASVIDMPKSCGDKLVELMDSGSGYGICFLVASQEFGVVKDCMKGYHYDEEILEKFPKRIIFSLKSDEANMLIENISIRNDENMAYFTDGKSDGSLSFTPFLPPEPDKLRQFLQNLESNVPET